jgi:plasmid stability protein
MPLQAGLQRLDCNAITGYFQSEQEGVMASITIRNLDDDVKRRLRVRAAEHGRSMEEEAREILRDVVDETKPARNLAAAIRARGAPLGGVDLDLPKREDMKEPPAFDQA